MGATALNIRVGLFPEGWDKSLREMEMSLKSSGRKMAQLGNQISMSISAPLAAVGAVGVNLGMQLEDTFGKIENLVGIPREEIDKLKESVKTMSASLGQSQTSMADALYFIEGAGVKGAAALELLEAASKGTAIGLGATEEIAKVSGAALNAFKDQNLTASEAVNILAKTVKEGNMEAADLAPNLGKVLPVAASLGITFQEVGANLAIMSRLGISTSESVTTLRSMLSTLQAPSQQTAEALAKIGLSGDEVRKSLKERGLLATMQDLIARTDGNVDALGRIFPNIDGLVNVLGTAKLQGDEYAKSLANMNDATNIVNTGFERVSQTAGFKLKVAMESLRNIAIDLGSTLIPAIAAALKPLNMMLGAFGMLPEPIKIAAAAFGALLVVMGPAMSVFGSMKMAFGVLVGQVRSVVVAVNTATASFRAMAVAQQGMILITAVAAIWLMVEAFSALNSKVHEATGAQKVLNEISLTAQQAIVSERLEAERLISVINDETASREQKERALKRLKEINSQYFGDLTLEKSKVEDVTGALQKYIGAIEQRAKLSAANEKLVEIEKKLLDTQGMVNDAKPGWLESAGNAALAMGNGMRFAGLQQKDLGKNLAASTAELNAQKKALLDYIGTAEKAGQAVDNIKPPGATPPPGGKPKGLPKGNGAGDGMEAETKKVKAYAEAVKSIADLKNTQIVIGKIDFDEQAKEFESQLKNLIKAGFTIDSAQIKEFQAGLQKAVELDKGMPILPSLKIPDEVISQNTVVADSFARVAAAVQAVQPAVTTLAQTFSETFAIAMEKVAANGDMVSQAAMVMGQSMYQSAEQGETSMKKMALAAVAAGAKIIRAYIMQGVASVVKSALINVPFPANIAIAAAAGGAAGVLFNKAIGKIGIPALAEGGVAFGPTMALVGDNPGARANPEVIAPLDKLKDMMGGGGSQHVVVEGIIRGQDIFITNQREAQRRVRVNGLGQ
jgi:TP901 family phage tail tape measure protein